jgi:hypothetical protein
VEITSFPYVVEYAVGTELNLEAVSGAGVFSAWSGDIVSDSQGTLLHVHKSLISVYEGYFGVNISLI